MDTIKFVRQFLKSTAKVCVVTTKGDIRYTGRVKDICWEHYAANTTLVSVEGLGSENDLILNIAEEEQA